jgi:preprotein translocase subunit SecA
MFAAMLDRVKFETVSTLSKVEVRTQEEVDREEEERRQRLMRALQAKHDEMGSLLSGAGESPPEDTPQAPQGPASGRGPAGRPIAGGAAQPVPPPPAAEHQGTFVRGDRKVGRNEPCPCGSGKKFKHCHGALSSYG